LFLRSAPLPSGSGRRLRGLDVPDDAEVTIGETTGTGEAAARKLEVDVDIHIKWCFCRICLTLDIARR